MDITHFEEPGFRGFENVDTCIVLKQRHAGITFFNRQLRFKGMF